MIPDYIKALEGCLLRYTERYSYVKGLSWFGLKDNFNIQYFFSTSKISACFNFKWTFYSF